MRTPSIPRQTVTAIAAAVTVALSGCASTGGPADPRDPAEGFNRAMFRVNEGLDTVLVKPLATGYDTVAPLPAKVAVGNFFGNIGDLWIAFNNLLQGKVGDAFSDVGRVLVNTTVGIGGVFDVASEVGFEKHNEDFGQTLGRWGVGEGAYVFLPVLGPRTVRDTVGFGVDAWADPVGDLSHVPTRNAARGLRFVDLRARLLPTDKVVEEAAIDKYSYIRDSYLQMRRAQVHDGKPPRDEE